MKLDEGVVECKLTDSGALPPIPHTAAETFRNKSASQHPHTHTHTASQHAHTHSHTHSLTTCTYTQSHTQPHNMHTHTHTHTNSFFSLHSLYRYQLLVQSNFELENIEGYSCIMCVPHIHSLSYVTPESLYHRLWKESRLDRITSTSRTQRCVPVSQASLSDTFHYSVFPMQFFLS